MDSGEKSLYPRRPIEKFLQLQRTEQLSSRQITKDRKIDILNLIRIFLYYAFTKHV